MRALALVVLVGCSGTAVEHDPTLRARFDLATRSIPLPSDVWRDDGDARLVPPIDDVTLTAAERELYGYLRTLDGWSSEATATVDFSGALAVDSIDATTVQVWQWGAAPAPVDGAAVTLSADGTRLAIRPPVGGWLRSQTYVVAVRGGALGVTGAHGEPVDAELAFAPLRDVTPMADPALEALRTAIAPMADFLDGHGLPRADLAALWKFTVTARPELAMDLASQRVPLPCQLLVDPDTGLIDLPALPTDRDFEREAKAGLSHLDGFATSASLLIELTAPVDGSTITADTVQLWRLSNPPTRVAATPTLMADGVHVVLAPDTLPLAAHARFGVVVTDGVRDALGRAPAAMPTSRLLIADGPALADGRSQAALVSDADAARVEPARAMMGLLRAGLDRAHVVAAWPFETQDVLGHVQAMVDTAATLAVDPRPTLGVRQTPAAALDDFALAVGSLGSVHAVVEGTLPSPEFLDATTRGWRVDGGHTTEGIAFTATVPDGVDPSRPLPVVIFGHGVMTERRFVLAIGAALADRGIAAIAIDLPYHGTRTACLAGGPLSVVDPSTGDVTSLSPCQAGARCEPDGRCVGASDGGDGLARWPLLHMPVASGAAFLELDHLAHTKEHLDQALVDLGALARSLRLADWRPLFGAAVDPTRIYYAGQSLGSILGASFLAASPDIQRAVLNVPGADLVGLLRDSPFFSAQLTGLFTRVGVDAASYDGERLIALARWLVDADDPYSLGAETGDRALLLQMATLDAIIPNPYTLALQRVTGAPRRDYVAEHGFLVIPVEPAYFGGGDDLAAFLDDDL